MIWRDMTTFVATGMAAANRGIVGYTQGLVPRGGDHYWTHP